MAVGLIALGTVLSLTAWARLSLYDRPEIEEEGLKEVLLVPPGPVIRQVDLGYHTLVADLLFIRANVYYGHHMHSDEHTPWITDFIDILIELDPQFKKAYLWGATVTTYYKRQIDFVPEERLLRANQLLEAGMHRFPEDYRFPMRIGFNLYYEMGDAVSAIPYFERASRLPGAPPDLKRTVTDLLAKKGDRQLATEMVTAILADTEDEQLSADMISRLSTILDPDRRDHYMALHQDLVGEWKSRYAFLNYDQFLLVRDP